MASEPFRSMITGLASLHPSVPALQFIRDDPEGVHIVLLGAGSCNHVIRVTSHDGKNSVIVKQAPPFPKSFVNMALPQDRVNNEYHALRRFHTVEPGLVPIPYCLDETLHTFAMEDLAGMENLSESLNAGQVDVYAAQEVARRLGRVHAATWRNDVPLEVWKTMNMEQFRNPALKLFRRNTGHVWCLDETNVLNKIEGVLLDQFHVWLREGVFERPLQELGDRLVEAEDCLVHGDLYTASIMRSEGHVRIIDMEFACLGPVGIDMGFFIGSYFMAFFRHLGLANHQVTCQCIEAIKDALHAYLDALGPTVNRHGTRRDVIVDITGYTAWTLFRFPIFTDIGLHFDLSPETKIKCLEAAIKGFKSYKTVDTVDKLVETFIPRLPL